MVKLTSEARIQDLNPEMKLFAAKKLADDDMLSAFIGVVGALTTILPTMNIIMIRGKDDPQLDSQALAALVAIKLLVLTHSKLTTDGL